MHGERVDDTVIFADNIIYIVRYENMSIFDVVERERARGFEEESCFSVVGDV